MHSHDCLHPTDYVCNSWSETGILAQAPLCKIPQLIWHRWTRLRSLRLSAECHFVDHLGVKGDVAEWFLTAVQLKRKTNMISIHVKWLNKMNEKQHLNDCTAECIDVTRKVRPENVTTEKLWGRPPNGDAAEASKGACVRIGEYGKTKVSQTRFMIFIDKNVSAT